MLEKEKNQKEQLKRNHPKENLLRDQKESPEDVGLDLVNLLRDHKQDHKQDREFHLNQVPK